MEGVLNQKQQACFDAFQTGQSIVITGPAGCGKSYLIREIDKWSRSKAVSIAITALTGAAASLIGGVTLHGWSGIGLGKGSAEEIYNNMNRYRKKDIDKWRTTRILVIDEISMMDASLFNKLHRLGQIIRRNDDALFGGIQLVLCGDFAQLKPVVEKGTSFKFAFQSSIWEKYLSKSVFYLDQIVRQADPVFQQLLGRIRMGEYLPEDRVLLNSRLITDISDAEVDVIMPDGSKQTIQSTLLFPRKKDVERINNMKLQELLDAGHSSKVYDAHDHVINRKTRCIVTDKQPTGTGQKVLDGCSAAPAKIVLCQGAQVMLIKNMDMTRQLVNGSRGVVTRIDGAGLPVVLFDNGEEVTIQYETFETESGENIYVRKQIPLILAWALTIHKCQGASLSSVITDLTDVFDEAQVYVTLSRARTLDGLFIINLDYNKIKCNRQVKDYYRKQ